MIGTFEPLSQGLVDQEVPREELSDDGSMPGGITSRDRKAAGEVPGDVPAFLGQAH